MVVQDFKRAIGRRPETWTGVLIVISTLLRLVMAWVVPPLGDEVYYWHLGSQFHLSYFDHPSLAYWLAALGHGLGVPGGFVIARLPFVLLFSGSTWLMFLTGRRLFGGWAGFHAALLLNLTVFFPIGAGAFALPEGPLVFSWLACLWFLSRILFNPKAVVGQTGLSRSASVFGVYPEPEVGPTGLSVNRAVSVFGSIEHLPGWLGLGACLGMALLSKYHAVFIPFGTGLAVLTAPGLRRWAWSAGPYLALVMAAIVSLPVIVWNSQHDWISFVYQFGRGTRFRGIQPEAALKSLAGQAWLLMPWIWFFLIREWVRGFAKGPRSPVGWFLSLMAVGPIAAFTILAVCNRQWYMFHWQAVGYLSLFPALGASVAVALEKGAGWMRWGLAFSTAAILATCGLILLCCSIITSGLISQPVPSVAPSAAMARNYDLCAFAGLDETLEQRGLLSDPNLFVFTSHYMDTGRAAWVLRGKVPVLCFAPEDGAKSHPFGERASGWLGANGLALSRSEDVAGDLALFSPCFRRMTPLGTVKVGCGLHQTVLHLHRFEDMIRPFTFPYGSPSRPWGRGNARP